VYKTTTAETPLTEHSFSRVGSRDEDYVISLCDTVTGYAGLKQHKFDFLLGDPSSSGQRRRLPVDVYYPDLSLVIEYRERQHTEAVLHFDKPDVMTVSGVHRGEQRRIYDERRREVLPQHGIQLLEISYSVFNTDSARRIIRDPERDVERVRQELLKAGVLSQN
jgi:hypothetical protein